MVQHLILPRAPNQKLAISSTPAYYYPGKSILSLEGDLVLL